MCTDFNTCFRKQNDKMNNQANIMSERRNGQTASGLQGQTNGKNKRARARDLEDTTREGSALLLRRLSSESGNLTCSLPVCIPIYFSPRLATHTVVTSQIRYDERCLRGLFQCTKRRVFVRTALIFYLYIPARQEQNSVSRTHWAWCPCGIYVYGPRELATRQSQHILP